MKKTIVVAILLVFAASAALSAHAQKQAKGAPHPMVVKSCAEAPPEARKRRGFVGAIPPPAPMAMAKPSAAPPAGAQLKREAAPLREGGKPDVHAAAKKVPKDVQKASEIYLSNDDSMSLASAQRIFSAIDNFLTLYRSQIRPHELLNYYHFQTLPPSGGSPFSVRADALADKGQTTLSFAVQGRTLTKEARRPAVITLIVDRSGSMSDKGKMDYLRAGLAALKGQLKSGDVVTMTWFDHEVCTPLESMVVGRDSLRALDKSLADLKPRGSTNLHDGLVEGYKLAEKYFDPAKLNRVILITDAIANRGELSADLMSSIGKYYDTKRIALSGVGVGQNFNDELLDEITDRGKGAYLFLGSEAATKRVFGTDFISLLETVARNVHFKVTLPKALRLRQFYGEEVSTEKAKVQPIHYFANTSQLFLMDLKGTPEGADEVGFEISYEDPDGGAERAQTEKIPLAQISQGSHDNILKARIIMAFADLLEKTAAEEAMPCPSFCFLPFERSKVDVEKGKRLCDESYQRMKELAAQYSDAEVKEVLDKAAKYCSRF